MTITRDEAVAIARAAAAKKPESYTGDGVTFEPHEWVIDAIIEASKRTYFTDVAAFHAKMGLPVAANGRGSRLLTPSEFKYRDNFIHEEHREFIEAYGERDVAKMTDALADLIYVALGTAHYMGVPFDQVWDAVQKANLAKRPWREGDPVKPRNMVSFEVTKPEGWRPPAVDEIIEAWDTKQRGSN